jgi:propionate CoA-transferase
VVYVGSFTTGGLKILAADGKLSIPAEGKHKKLVAKVEQITSSGAYASKVRQKVLFVTERAVFELRDGGLVLIEVAPGIDVDKDILAQMDFKPKVSAHLKPMPSGLFLPKWGDLRAIIESAGATPMPAAA